MSSYQQKLTEFSEGKRLNRLPDTIKDFANTDCDACGSSQPRTLNVVKERSTDRYYFLGDNCLRELMKRGTVGRRLARESGERAYEREMHFRAQGLPQSPNSTVQDETPELVSTPAGGLAPAGAPIILVSKTWEHYRAFICYASDQGISHWGLAEEARLTQGWRLGGDHGLLLEKRTEEQSDAMARCLTKAWEEANSNRTRSGQTTIERDDCQMPNSLLKVIQLAERALDTDSPPVPTTDGLTS